MLLRQIAGVRAWLALTVTLGIAAAGATIAQMILLSGVVNGVFLDHRSLTQVSVSLALLLIAALLRAALLWGREVTAQRAAVRAKAALRERLFAHLLRLGPAYVHGERTGELVTTTMEGVERLDAYVSRYLPQLALSVAVPLLIAACIVPLDWVSGVLLLVTGPIIPLLMILIGSYAEDRMSEQWLALSRMSAHFLDAVQGLPTLKLFGAAQREHARVAQVSDAVREKTLGVLRIAFLSGAVLEFMVAAAIGLVAISLGIRLLDGGIAFVRAFAVLLLAPEFYRPLRELGVQRHAGMEGKAAAKRIVEILETPPTVRERTSVGAPPTGALAISLEDVHVTYPGAEREALAGVSLTLAAGSRTALVGPSGAGKSTLANLLTRFLDPSAGCIRVSGMPLADLPIQLWREQVALVPQRPYLFSGTVAENIRLARPSATDEEVATAAGLAGAAEFIARLPQGFATAVGEQGARLSAGQLQRIAIARAFLKDAPLLILDEPTSSLDPESEAWVRDALERLMAGRTVLVIAHRLNTVAGAQQIAVLDGGCLVEVGTHAELLRRGGLYARLTGARAAGPVTA